MSPIPTTAVPSPSASSAVTLNWLIPDIIFVGVVLLCVFSFAMYKLVKAGWIGKLFCRGTPSPLPVWNDKSAATSAESPSSAIGPKVASSTASAIQTELRTPSAVAPSLIRISTSSAAASDSKDGQAPSPVSAKWSPVRQASNLVPPSPIELSFSSRSSATDASDLSEGCSTPSSQDTSATSFDFPSPPECKAQGEVAEAHVMSSSPLRYTCATAAESPASVYTTEFVRDISIKSSSSASSSYSWNSTCTLESAPDVLEALAQVEDVSAAESLPDVTVSVVSPSVSCSSTSTYSSISSIIQKFPAHPPLALGYPPVGPSGGDVEVEVEDETDLGLPSSLAVLDDLEAIPQVGDASPASPSSVTVSVIPPSESSSSTSTYSSISSIIQKFPSPPPLALGYPPAGPSGDDVEDEDEDKEMGLSVSSSFSSYTAATNVRMAKLPNEDDETDLGLSSTLASYTDSKLVLPRSHYYIPLGCRVGYSLSDIPSASVTLASPPPRIIIESSSSLEKLATTSASRLRPFKISKTYYFTLPTPPATPTPFSSASSSRSHSPATSLSPALGPAFLSPSPFQSPSPSPSPSRSPSPSPSALDPEYPSRPGNPLGSLLLSDDEAEEEFFSPPSRPNNPLASRFFMVDRDEDLSPPRPDSMLLPSIVGEDEEGDDFCSPPPSDNLLPAIVDRDEEDDVFSPPPSLSLIKQDKQASAPPPTRGAILSTIPEGDEDDKPPPPSAPSSLYSLKPSPSSFSLCSTKSYSSGLSSFAPLPKCSSPKLSSIPVRVRLRCVNPAYYPPPTLDTILEVAEE